MIENSRHSSPTNFFVHLLAGLIAHTWQDKKPSLNLYHGAHAQLTKVSVRKFPVSNVRLMGGQVATTESTDRF